MPRRAWSGAEQRHQWMSGDVYRRLPVLRDDRIQLVVHRHRRVHGIRLRGDVAHHYRHHVGSFHLPRYPHEGVRQLEVTHDLVLALQGGAELVIVGVALLAAGNRRGPGDAGSHQLRAGHAGAQGDRNVRSACAGCCRSDEQGHSQQRQQAAAQPFGHRHTVRESHAFYFLCKNVSTKQAKVTLNFGLAEWLKLYTKTAGATRDSAPSGGLQSWVEHALRACIFQRHHRHAL